MRKASAAPPERTGTRRSGESGGPADPEVQARYFTAACQAASYYHMTAIYFYEIPLADNPSNPSKFPAFFVGNVGASAIRACAGASCIIVGFSDAMGSDWSWF